MRLLLLLSVGFFLSERIYCQDTDYSIENIKAYVKMIDSLSGVKTYLKIGMAEQMKLVLSISEGTVKNPKRGLKGGFSKTTITGADDTVYSIQYHDNLKKNLYQSYYFKSGKLVFSRIELQNDDGQNATLFFQEEFYADDKIILSTIDINKLIKKYEWRTDFSPQVHGYAYLKEFKERP
jgi:hypothetical protein